MASDQTPSARDAIEAAIAGHQFLYVGHEEGWTCGCDEYGELPFMQFRSDAEKHQADAVEFALDAAGFAIVPKVPAGDKPRSSELEAAMAAYYEVFTGGHDHEEALAAALAAAKAAEEVPDGE